MKLIGVGRERAKLTRDRVKRERKAGEQKKKRKQNKWLARRRCIVQTRKLQFARDAGNRG